MAKQGTTRRNFLESSGKATAVAALTTGGLMSRIVGQQGISPEGPSVEILNPMNRVPLSFIIDDSTCLVNMGHFCMPQFAEAWPERGIYDKPWKSWPREIPDAFVREYGEWCADHGVRGKYSVVPFPACVGWLDRELPGWSRKELKASLKLVRELLVPNWDIHPEMISHTRVIDIRSGRPLEEISSATMENSYPQEQKSVDELAGYLAYALKILKNCDLPCEGITTPGGFGSLVKSELSLAVQQAVRSVYSSEIPHFFKYVSEGDESTEPLLEHVSAVGLDHQNLTVNIPAGTGDWFGGWDGDREPEPDRYLTRDGSGGRLAELIQKGQPGTFLCHWPGMYTQGSRKGFAAFKQVVLALNEHYGSQTIWMKLSEMARYWTAKKLTTIEVDPGNLQLSAPVACPAFTVAISTELMKPPEVEFQGSRRALAETPRLDQLKPGTWLRDGAKTLLSFDLPKGVSTVHL